MDQQELLNNLFDHKMLKILRLFLKNDHEQYYLREIAKLTKVSPASTYRILGKFVLLSILEMQEIKTAKLYQLSKNKTVDFLKSIIEVDVVQSFVELASALDSVDQILLLGTKTKTKANLLLLGTSIDTARIKFIAGDLKEKYNFTINQMCLSKEQYEQMSSMGLYPGSKKILYST